MTEQPRVLIFSHADEPLGELAPGDVFGLVRHESINGENSLTVTTTQVLEQEQRILVRDSTLTWREYVVVGVDEAHQQGRSMIGEYYATWSIEHDLQGCYLTSQPGHQGDVAASVALAAVLGGTARWTAGTCDLSTTGSASFYYLDAWSAMGEAVSVWGGEVMPSITVGLSGVESRALNWVQAVGNSSPTRRFDYAGDVAGVTRHIDESPVYARVLPRGKGEETAGGGYGRKVTIESVNDGKPYLQNDATAPLVRLPDGAGGWEYPTIVIENNSIDDPSALKSWALSVIDQYTTPQATYDVDVAETDEAGASLYGVGLGDVVQVVDTAFWADTALRLEARAIELDVDMLTGRAKVTLGVGRRDIGEQLSTLSSRTSALTETVMGVTGGTMSTASYLSDLIERINAEINVGGGYTYIKPGQGIWVYDRAEDDDPTQVVRIMGGSISIANSRTSGGEWDWQTIMTGDDGILASAVTAAQLTAGYIGSAASGNFWNLDTGELTIAGYATTSDVAEAVADGAVSANLLLDTNQASLTAAAGPAARYFSSANNSQPVPSLVTISDAPQPGITAGARFVVSSTATTGRALTFYSGEVVPLVDGEKYTLSCWARVTDGTSMVVMLQLGVSSYMRKDVEVSGSGWQMVSATFTYTDSGTGGTGGARAYLGCVATYAGTLELCGFCLRRGTVAADWTPNSLDTDASAVAEAEAAAADAVEAQTQADIFNKLTNNGATQGLYISDGLLYVNASYIGTGTLSADRIASSSITADKIDAAQLVSPKVGSSSTSYGEIGTVSYQGSEHYGLIVTRNGDPAFEICNGETDVVWAVEMTDGTMLPVVYATQDAVFLQSMGVIPSGGGAALAQYSLMLGASGLQMVYTNGTTTKTQTIPWSS